MLTDWAAIKAQGAAKPYILFEQGDNGIIYPTDGNVPGFSVNITSSHTFEIETPGDSLFVCIFWGYSCSASIISAGDLEFENHVGSCLPQRPLPGRREFYEHWFNELIHKKATEWEAACERTHQHLASVGMEHVLGAK